jgi:hypothetical protein
MNRSVKNNHNTQQNLFYAALSDGREIEKMIRGILRCINSEIRQQSRHIMRIPAQTTAALFALRPYVNMISEKNLDKILSGLKSEMKNIPDEVFQTHVVDILQPAEGEDGCY